MIKASFADNITNAIACLCRKEARLQRLVCAYYLNDPNCYLCSPVYQFLSQAHCNTPTPRNLDIIDWPHVGCKRGQDSSWDQ